MQPSDPDGHSAREPVFFLPRIITLAALICAGLYVFEEYVLSDAQAANLIWGMAFVPARMAELSFSALFEFVRTAVTSSLMHADFAHLAVNMVWLAAFGAPLAQRIGPARFAAFWLLTAFCAALLHFLTHTGDPSPMVGASGVVSGAMGAAARFGFAASGRRGPRAFTGAPLTMGEAVRNKSVISFIAVWAVINFVSGAGVLDLGQGGASIAWEAHVGGFLAGFFGLRLFDGRPA